MIILLGYPSERRLHQSVVCHEDIPDTQHPDHHDMVLETDHPHEQTPCAAGEVSAYLIVVNMVLLAQHLLLLNNHNSECGNSAWNHCPEMNNVCN